MNSSGPRDEARDEGESRSLAPVTYIFGATPGAADDVVPEGHAQLSPSHPVFRDETIVSSIRPIRAVSAQEPNRAEPAEPESSQADSTHAESGNAESGRGRFDRVNNVSMYALARRGMSSSEMRDYLVGREFGAEVVEAEIDRLERVGLLDDAELAETLVRTLRERKGLGRAALTSELKRRHVDSGAIEEAMGGLDDDELERATAIAIKRAPQVRALDSTTAKRRLGAFLMRKGYSGSVVSAAVQRALADSGPAFR